MNKKMMLVLSVAFMLTIGVCGMAVAGGGGPDPTACSGVLPSPDSGEFIKGEFTVAPFIYYGLSGGGVGEVKVYTVHASFKKGSKQEAVRRLFTFPATPLPPQKNLCTVTAEELISTFQKAPCRAGVAEAFNLFGTPVITNLEIEQVDNCGEADGEMLQAEIVIRVVP